jgi:hypothetical protein
VSKRLQRGFEGDNHANSTDVSRVAAALTEAECSFDFIPMVFSIFGNI